MSDQQARQAILISALPMPAKRSPQRRGRRNIRHRNEEDISELTLVAIKDEERRKKRVQKRRALCDELFEVGSTSDENTDRLILDFDRSTKRELIVVDRKLVPKLKKHQRTGVKFLWDACYESLEEVESERSGGGAVLAHCMGLGKTLQIVAFVHTLFRHQETKVKTVLILSPVSTLLNWEAEFEKWLKDLDDWGKMSVCVLQSRTTKPKDRVRILTRWTKNGGVLIMGYDLFRSLKKTSTNEDDEIYRALKEPGPDLVICDEGHILKNNETGVSKAMMEIKTRRRVMLTGTPLQNNLMEYYCMVQFVRPNLLGSKEEFRAHFVNPIENAQYIDSTSEDVKLMTERTRLLHSILDGFIQRLDHNVLKPFLPPKLEFVLSIGMSDTQVQLYEYYLRNRSSKAQLFRDCDAMRLIWTHPLALKLNEDTRQKKQKYKAASSGRSTAVNNANSLVTGDSICRGEIKDEKNKRDPVKSSDDNELGIDFNKINISTPEDKKNDEGKQNQNQNQDKDSEVNELGIDFDKLKISSSEETNSPWWSRLVAEEDFDDYEKGPKLVLLFALLNQCEKIGDKVLVFSQSIASLDMIEYFLKKNSSRGPLGSGKWEKNLDYFRFDGQTANEKRMEFCEAFNRDDNKRARLFLISTKAGGLGINLTAANRVIVFDATWNPSFDIQSIFRVYRLGQSKPCYIYRFVSQGTMEEKIYERQVIKQSVSCRVVDEQNIHRHFTQREITELYAFNRKTPSNQPQKLPNDDLMAQLLKEYSNLIIGYHVHDSLLENIEEDFKSDSPGVGNVERKLKNIGYNLEEQKQASKNVEGKPTSVDRKRQPAIESPAKESKDCKNVREQPTSVDRKRQPAIESPAKESKDCENVKEQPTSADRKPRPAMESRAKDGKNVDDKPRSVNRKLQTSMEGRAKDSKNYENVKDKPTSVDRKPQSAMEGRAKDSKDYKNVKDKLTSVDRKPQSAMEGGAKDWKDDVAETIDQIKDDWITNAIQKLYPGDWKIRERTELSFQIRKKLFYDYRDEKKRNRVKQLFGTSTGDVPFEVAMDIMRAVNETIPNFIRMMGKELGGSGQTPLWNKKTFVHEELKKVETEFISKTILELHVNDWMDGKFKMSKMVKQVRKALFRRYMRETEIDTFNKLLVAFVFGNNEQNSAIESQVLVDAIESAFQTFLDPKTPIPHTNSH